MQMAGLFPLTTARMEEESWPLQFPTGKQQPGTGGRSKVLGGEGSVAAAQVEPLQSFQQGRALGSCAERELSGLEAAADACLSRQKTETAPHRGSPAKDQAELGGLQRHGGQLKFCHAALQPDWTLEVDSQVLRCVQPAPGDLEPPSLSAIWNTQ